MGKPSKRRKSDGIQFNIGKRIKVQAQRKFAQGAAVLPQQVPKENTSIPNNDNNAKTQPKKMEFIMPSTPKVYTEDFLTFLCFKSSQSLPSHLRVTSFLQPQAIYTSPANQMTTSLECNSQIPQTLSTVQGFIPFGVRKQASQFPKKNMSRKASLQAIKNQFNKQKPARYQVLSAKKTTNTIESRKKILTKANGKVAIAKTITKKKQNIVLTSNYSISTRRQSYQQKTLRKKFTTLPTNQPRKNVSLRNRIISITSLKPDKIKLQETLKKKVDNVERTKSGKSPVVKSSALDKQNTKQNNTSSASKNTSTDTILSTSESSTVKTPIAKSKTTPKVSDGSSQMCRTRSSTVRQQKTTPNIPKKIITPKSKSSPIPKTSVSTPKKSKIGGFEFSSDDDEPLYKKLSNTPRDGEGLLEDQSSKQESGMHFTRSKLKDRPSVQNRQPKIVGNNTPKSPEVKTPASGMIASSRVTRQNITKSEVILNKTIAKQTRSKSNFNNNSNLKQSIDSAKNVSDSDKSSPKKIATVVKRSNELKRLEYEHHPIQRKSIEKPVGARNESDISNVSEKNDTNIVPTSLAEVSKKSEGKLEKSFSESDDEPLAAKLIETVKIDETKSKSKKGSKNEPPNLIDTVCVKGVNKLNFNKNNAKVNLQGSKLVINDTNPIPSYEESLKVYGIAHRYTDEKLSMTQSVKIKNCNQNKRLINKESNVLEKKHEFRGNYDASSIAAKIDLKNRQSRKFMKPKEYIEQWLKDSARPFANRGVADTSISDAINKLSKSITHVNLLVNSEDFMSQKPNICHQDAMPKPAVPNKNLITDTKSTSIDKVNESLVHNVLPKITPLEAPTDELNIYDFESESEMINSPPRKSKLIKEPQKRLDRCRSKFTNTFKPLSYKALDNVQMNELSAHEMFGEKINESENKLESFGNVISNAIIVSLDPSQEMPTKESQNILNKISPEHDKSIFNIKSGNAEGYTDGYHANKESFDSLQTVFADNLPANRTSNYTANKNVLLSNSEQSNQKPYLPDIQNQYLSIKNNSNSLDLLKTKNELISDANKNYHPSNNFSLNIPKHSYNLNNSLDFGNDMFFLQPKKDYIANSDNKPLLIQDYVRNTQNLQSGQVIGSDDNEKKFNTANFYKNLPMSSIGVAKPFFQTNNGKPEPSNDNGSTNVESDLTQTSSYSAQRSMLSSLTDFEKRAYLTNHIPTPQINIPKYERPKRTYNVTNKPDAKYSQSLLKISSSDSQMKNVETYPPIFDGSQSIQREIVTKQNQIQNCNIKNPEHPTLINKMENGNSFQTVNKNEDLTKNIGYYNSDMFASQPTVQCKMYNNFLGNTPYLNEMKLNNTNTYLPLVSKTDENVKNNHPADLKAGHMNQLQNVNYFKTDLISSVNNMNENSALAFSNKMPNNIMESSVKLSSLQFGKNSSPGTDSISKISLKNFRLSTDMSGGSQPISIANIQTPEIDSSLGKVGDCVQTSDLTLKAPAGNCSRPKESENHLFYIPLHGTSRTGNDMSNHLIEGVAVKMDTQGPDGPQQRVIMRAKLVRKSQINKNVPKAMDKQTGPIMEMVRSVREAFPEATIHGDTPPSEESAAPKDKKVAKTSGVAANRRSAVNAKQKEVVSINPVSSKSSTCSSQSSNSALRRNCVKAAADVSETIYHKNKTSFPQMEDAAQIVEAPIFQPTEKEFQDPLEFIEKISPIAARYGLCRIIPPPNFKSECKISDDMRFTPHNQYLHRMLYRWGSSSREMCAIKKYLATQSVTFKQPPNLCGIEVDLPKLYHIVQNMGGLNKVLEKKMWHRVAEEMCLPLNVHYMDIRLDEIYCKYLLPYDTLSPDERKKLFESVDQEWAKRQNRMVTRAANPLNGIETEELEYDITEDVEECITRGKSITLCSYARTAKNTMAMQFGKTPQPTPDEVESKFWNYVTARDSHICVSTGSIDSSVWGYGFPNAKSKNSPISKHPWNLKVLTNNSGSILRSLGPIMGVTVPTIHVGMLFSTCCWYRDPHGLPWVEYLHDGAPKIWYGVPDSQSVKFKETLTSIVPGYCQKKTVWLLSDTTMVPPKMLKEHGVSLCRTVQHPGEFILVFPKAFTSSICAGYNVSESVYFAPNSWLDTAQQDFVDIRNSCEPTMFSLERLIVAMSQDIRTPYQILKKVLPALNKIIQTEKQHREALFNVGLKASERSQNVFIGKKKVAKRQDEVEECHRCRTSLSLSMLYNDSDGSVFCLIHAAEFLSTNQTQIDKCKLIYMHSIDELERLLSKLIERINVLANKKCSKVK
ncbi:jumonji, AT rich interactive domain 2 [Arctopsyche grandis]|uniref:jumonji, AT rich interactive domain 2 n=1 Tax=Arctopsyche grandis TaxID=121162 RepID=UPI00406D919B